MEGRNAENTEYTDNTDKPYIQRTQSKKRLRKRWGKYSDQRDKHNSIQTKLKDVVNQVQYQGYTYVISCYEKPAAAAVPIGVYENRKRQRGDFFDLFRDVQKRADREPEEADRLAFEAVAAAHE